MGAMTRLLPAILAALGVLAAQAFYGGLLRPFFALPGYLLVGLAGVAGLGALWKKTPSSPWVLPLSLTLAFAGWLLWRISAGPDDFITGDMRRLVWACLTIYLVFAVPSANPRARLIFLAVMILAGLIQAALGGYQFLRRSPDMPLPWASEALRVWYAGRLGMRAHGFFISGNHLAWLLNIAGLSALACGCWARWPIGARILALYAAAMCLAGCLPTLSRGGFIGLATGLSVFLLVSGFALTRVARGFRIPAFLAVGAGVLVAVGAAWLVFAESWAIQARLSLLTDDSYREGIFRVGRRLFESAPLLGAGAGAFPDAARALRSVAFEADDLFAHNDWLQIAAEFGFPALALLGLLIAVHGYFGFRALALASQRRAVHGGISSNTVAVQVAGLSTLAACAAHALFDFNMQIPANALLAAACLGLLANPGLEPRGIRKKAGFVVACLLTALSGTVLIVQTIQARPALKNHMTAENALATGDPESAWETLSTFLKAQPGSRDHLVLRARTALDLSQRATAISEKRGLAEVAVRDLGQAAQIRPLNVHQNIDLALAQGRLGQFAAAEHSALRAIAMYPFSYGGYQSLGLALEAQGRIPEALRAYALAAPLPHAEFSRERIKWLTKKPPTK